MNLPPIWGWSIEVKRTVAGTWELLYSSTQLFLSSPFFLVRRLTCTMVKQARQYDWFCNMHGAALAISIVEIKGWNVPILRNLLDLENVALQSWDLSKVILGSIEL